MKLCKSSFVFVTGQVSAMFGSISLLLTAVVAVIAVLVL